MKNKSHIELNRITLFDFKNSELKFQSGCCTALCRLSEQFLITQFASSWGCCPAKPIAAKENDEKFGMQRPPSRSVSQTR